MARQFPPFEFGSTGNEREAGFEDYRRVGEKIVEWAMNPDSWPKNMTELRQALAPHIKIPDRYTKLRVVQADDDEFILRLPPKGQITESKQIAEADPTGDYNLPRPYVKHWILNKEDDQGEFVEQVDALFARVADYTMRGCR